MTTRRKVLLGIAALLVLLLVLRELGVVDMSLYTSSAEWRFTSTYGDGERPEDPGGGFAYTTRTDPARRTVQLEGSTGSGPVDSIGRLTRFDVEGLTWVPLHKTGRATFAAGTQVPLVVSGTLIDGCEFIATDCIQITSNVDGE